MKYWYYSFQIYADKTPKYIPQTRTLSSNSQHFPIVEIKESQTSLIANEKNLWDSQDVTIVIIHSVEISAEDYEQLNKK